MKKMFTVWGAIVLSVLVGGGIVACDDTTEATKVTDAGPGATDASQDAPGEASADAGGDAVSEASTDAATDAATDAPEDTGTDAPADADNAG